VGDADGDGDGNGDGNVNVQRGVAGRLCAEEHQAAPSDRQHGKLSIVEYARGDINLPPEI
jgi:hypothetical protein